MVASFMPELDIPATPSLGIVLTPYTVKRAAERRVFARRDLSTRIEGKRLDHSIAALRHPHLSLSLRDLSAGGLSAISPAPLQPGERLTVSFPVKGPRSHNTPAEWDAVGRVVRCEASSMGYRVAIEFDSLPSAA